jgi:hypothetical protein
MDLHLTSEQVDLLIAELYQIIDGDRYFLAPRIRALREIRALLKPYPAQAAAASSQKVYEPPTKGRYRRRG